jgi:hypothetical protein
VGIYGKMAGNTGLYAGLQGVKGNITHKMPRLKPKPLAP